MTLTFRIGPRVWITSNGRYHWREKARRSKDLRTLAKLQALNELRQGTIEALDRTHVIAHVSMPTSRRFDPANAHPTVKALIDGLVDAGVLPDDDREHLVGPDYRAADKTGESGLYRIRLELEKIP